MVHQPCHRLTSPSFGVSLRIKRITYKQGSQLRIAVDVWLKQICFEISFREALLAVTESCRVIIVNHNYPLMTCSRTN